MAYKVDKKMKKVWVVEDDPGIREIIGMLLEDEGYEVSLFENASQFNMALRSQPNHIDAMVMDVMLPDGNGIHLCHKVKSSESFNNVPVLMMSANTTFCDVERFCRADDFIPKPFNIDEMAKKVSRLMA